MPDGADRRIWVGHPLLESCDGGLDAAARCNADPGSLGESQCKIHDFAFSLPSLHPSAARNPAEFNEEARARMTLMRTATRRQFVRSLAVAGLPSKIAIAVPRSTGIRIKDIQHDYQEFRYRAAYKFGGSLVDRV